MAAADKMMVTLTTVTTLRRTAALARVDGYEFAANIYDGLADEIEKSPGITGQQLAQRIADRIGITG